MAEQLLRSGAVAAAKMLVDLSEPESDGTPLHLPTLALNIGAVK